MQHMFIFFGDEQQAENARGISIASVKSARMLPRAGCSIRRACNALGLQLEYGLQAAVAVYVWNPGLVLGTKLDHELPAR